MLRFAGLKTAEKTPVRPSGGEQQRAALAKVLLSRPKILLLDEPTKGIDAEFKEVLADIINTLTQSGVTVVMVSHDVEFYAKYPHRCMMFSAATLCRRQLRSSLPQIHLCNERKQDFTQYY